PRGEELLDGVGERLGCLLAAIVQPRQVGGFLLATLLLLERGVRGDGLPPHVLGGAKVTREVTDLALELRLLLLRVPQRTPLAPALAARVLAAEDDLLGYPLRLGRRRVEFPDTDRVLLAEVGERRLELFQRNGHCSVPHSSNTGCCCCCCSS